MKKILSGKNNHRTLTPNPSPKGRGEIKKVLIALSGGIDSAVSAYLLQKQGYEVEAAFMKNWSSTAGLLKNECPWLIDRQDALRVAAFLRIPLHTLDFEKQYQKTVMKYFFEEYKKGRTPNPDVMCNKEIKFKLLYNWAMGHGFGYLATGHYAQIYTTPSRFAGHPSLAGGEAPRSLSSFSRRSTPRKRGEVVGVENRIMRSIDEFKDQTYFIYNIKTEQLPHILFPIGGMKKPAVRSLARKIGLPNAEKKESMGLCFVGKIRLSEFLRQKLKVKEGLIIDQDGKSIGRHQGLFNYTIGQRQGIAVGGTGPYYVVKKDLKANTLYVTNNPDDESLMVKEIQIHSVNWIGSPPGTGGVPAVGGGGGRGRIGNGNTIPSRFLLRQGYGGQVAGYPSYIRRGGSAVLHGRFRHQGELVELTLKKIDQSHYQVNFFHPQKAVASGQSLVLYKGKECVGGGVIG